MLLGYNACVFPLHVDVGPYGRRKASEGCHITAVMGLNNVLACYS